MIIAIFFPHSDIVCTLPISYCVEWGFFHPFFLHCQHEFDVKDLANHLVPTLVNCWKHYLNDSSTVQSASGFILMSFCINYVVMFSFLCLTGYLGLHLYSSVCSFLFIHVTSCGSRRLSPALYHAFTNTTIQPRLPVWPRWEALSLKWPCWLDLQENWWRSLPVWTHSLKLQDIPNIPWPMGIVSHGLRQLLGVADW